MKISDYQIGKNHGLELAQVYIDAILRYSDDEDKNMNWEISSAIECFKNKVWILPYRKEKLERIMK